MLAEEITKKEALQNFLLDIDCLDKISKWSNKFNMFDVLKISRTEIRHSNMLAWLIDPNESHGFEDSILRGILQNLIKNNEFKEIDAFKLLLMDFKSVTVFREKHNIDLLAVFEKENFVLCIENKIGSGEHDNQLKRYTAIIEKEYPYFKKLFVFLTPDATEPSGDNWCLLSYTDLLQIISASKNRTKMQPDIELLVDNYIDVIRRDIVGDEELMQLCNEIYIKHRKALDLIYENRMDASYELFLVLKQWCENKFKEGLIGFISEDSVKSDVRFTTPFMDKILPPSSDKNGGWRNGNTYYYGIRNRNGKFYITLTICSLELTKQNQGMCNRLIKILDLKDKKLDWKWKRIFTTKTFNLNNSTPDEMIDQITNKLDSDLEEVFKFEQKIKTQLNT